MLTPYPVFYRRYGVRRVDQLMTPPLPSLQLLDLPREAVYHYLGTGPLDDGPTEAENALKANNKIVQVETVTEITQTLGNPRRLPMDINSLSRKYRVKNPRFRPMRSLETATRDPNALVIYNYAYLQRLYRYMRNYYASYNRWSNLLATLWTKMAEVANQSDRQQFVEFDLPQVLPSLSMLRGASRIVDQRYAQMFATQETLVQLHLWMWLGDERAKSPMAVLPEKGLSRINLIFRESGRWSVVNLGQLDAWRQATKEELKANPLANTKGLPAERMQKNVLRWMMSLFEARTQAVPENLGEDGPVVETPATPTPVVVPAPTATVVEPEPSSPDVEEDELPIDHQILDADQSLPDLPQDAQAQDNAWQEVDDDLEQLEQINQLAPVEDPQEPEIIEAVTPAEDQSLEGAIIAHCNALADAGALSAADYRRNIELAGNYKTITAPNGQSLGEFIQVPAEVVQISESASLPDKPTVLDKTMLKSSLLTFDRDYVTKVMQRDIAGMVTNLQRAGVLVLDYQVEDYEDITSSYRTFTVKVKPLQGTTSTLRFKIPKVTEDGTFKVNGVNYRSRKQIGDLPIRKISPSRVALTSYYGKLFAERSPKKVNDYGRWLRDQIMAMGLSPDNDVVSDLVPGNSFVNDFEAPRLYTMIAQGFRSFALNVKTGPDAGWWRFNFDAKRRIDLVGGNVGILRSVEKDGNILVAIKAQGGQLMVMDKEGALYRVIGSPQGNQLMALPALEEVLGIRTPKAPVEFAELRVFGKMISLGVILGYLLGLDNLVKRLGVTPRIVPTGQRTQLAADEWAISFLDETWVFSRDDTLATMVLAGWQDYHETTVQFSAHEFNRKDVYFNALEDQGLGVRYLRELDLMNQLFIDPITRELLVTMGEPTVMTELLIRSGELLTTDQHPDEIDTTNMRVKGYERFAGLLYGELVRSVRVHNARASKQNYPLELNPYAVWIAINEDPVKIQCDELNPIQNLKEAEAVTYAGTGGRSGRSMVKRTRAYHKSSMGIISEATVDNSDVGINTFLSADPQFDSLRGTSKGYVIGETGATALLSTSALLSVGAVQDDPKRVNFISIQHGHGVACEGYTQPQVRTGYEQTLSARNSDLFAVIARQPGKVRSVTSTGIIVDYADGTSQGVELGRRYGKAAGLVIPHEVVTPLQAGSSFDAGDALAYNAGFYEPDILNPKQVIWKSGRTVKTVLMEAADTLEDSSSISRKTSEHLTTKITKVRTVIVNFDQQIHNLVKARDRVEYESILCMIEDAVSANSDLLDSETLDTLRVLSKQSPQAKVRGVVERVEMYYNGEREDMSASLQALADLSDKAITARLRSTGKKVLNGSVDENFRIDNEPLLLDTAAIQIYITSDVPAGVGDKGVFGNQMKSVFGRVYEEVRTERGEEVDAIFSAASIDNRIVMSPFVIGTTNTLLKVLGDKMVQAYES